MAITKEELRDWLTENLAKPAMGEAYYVQPNWDPLNDPYDARRVAHWMKLQGWKFRIEATNSLEWLTTFSKWDDKGSKGAMGRCYGGLGEAICYAAYFAILSMRAVEAVRP